MNLFSRWKTPAVTALVALAAGIFLGAAYLPWVPGWVVIVGYALVYVTVSRLPSWPASFGIGTLIGVLHYGIAFFWAQTFQPLALAALTLVYGVTFFGLPSLVIRRLLRAPSWAIWGAPALWIVSEFVQEQWFLRFPFGVTGYTVSGFQLYIQMADLGGVALVSLFLHLAAFSLYRAWALRGTGPWVTRLIRARTPLLVFAGALALPFVYGAVRLATMLPDGAPVAKIGLAQTRQEVRRHQNDDADLLAVESLVEEGKGLKLDAIVFPELTINRPLTFESDLPLAGNADILNRISALAREVRTNLVLGSVERRRYQGRVKNYNSMYLFNAAGDLSGVFRKRELVPFGETNPLGDGAPWLGDYLTHTTDAVMLDAGESSNPLRLTTASGTVLSAGVLICFEDCFGWVARERVRHGAAVLFSVTDDLWPHSVPLMLQHAATAVFRAVETRTPILRVSNGGLTAYIDERGAVATALSLFEEGMMTCRLYLPPEPAASFYVAAGDWVPWLCLLVAAVCLAAAWRRR